MFDCDPSLRQTGELKDTGRGRAFYLERENFKPCNKTTSPHIVIGRHTSDSIS